VAHDLKNVDPVTNVPLAARVCYNVAGLQFLFQADTFQDILDYQAGGSVGAGPLLSALCAFMWFTKVRPPAHDAHLRRFPVARVARALHAQVVHEVGDALTTSRAVARLHGKTTSFVGGVVASVSTPRLLCFLAMQALRVAVAVLLGYGGAFFIGHTIALSDLILNCIALEVRFSFPPASSLPCVAVVTKCAPFPQQYGRWIAAPRSVGRARYVCIYIYIYVCVDIDIYM
jgi:hypothetical protein